MKYLNYVILYCLEKVHEERSIYSVFHILKGKKSSQSIQDTHLFELQPFFLSLPKLKREFFNEKVKELVSEGYLHISENEIGTLTLKGEKILKSELQTAFFPKDMNGLLFGDQCQLFWKRLSLLVQVLSNVKNKESIYYPVQRSRGVQDWVKRFLRAHSSEENISLTIYKELKQVLNLQLGKDDPSIFVHRLTGFEDYGWTESQVAEKLKMHEEEYRFRFLNFIHGILVELTKHPETYPILYSMSIKSDQTESLTISTAKTFDLLNRGFSLEEIARIRNLKQNTIEDHVIEILLTKEKINTEKFIKKEDIHEVNKVMDSLETKRLKAIKEKIPELSYFQIRVAITKAGDRNES
ncbi:helix-turn-helix domain-containing protein [Rossellomorea aquimaris]|uniref:helix-turn-helix domain-containing protein n=1 Tax=Rossellomorea aquimaris TaxID=189382 RepID=UPI0007D07852|nr:helix-turn-helix domain-containing protein [Rossellomorea aquimaris]